jgi:predicted secreted hydrolase
VPARVSVAKDQGQVLTRDVRPIIRSVSALGLLGLTALQGTGWRSGRPGADVAGAGPSSGVSSQTATSAPRSPAAGTLSSGWRQALPGYTFVFPRDHASHPAFKTEWWYYTGHLRAGEGRTFGFELTFFRFGVRPPGSPGRSAWTLKDVYAAHFAVTDEARGRFFSTDRLSRGALGMAGAATNRYRVWVEDWSSLLQLNNSSSVAIPAPNSRQGTHRPQAAGGGYGLDLAFRSTKPPAIHGQNGVSQKSAGLGRASHYYSLTRLLGSGTLATPQGRFSVEAVAWMDHEFGSNQLGADQVGWDWFSLQLEDGRELMLYQLRLRDGRVEPFSSGTMVERDGSTRHLRRIDFDVTVLARWRSPKTGGIYPSRWRVRVPSARLVLTLAPAVSDQELVTTGSTGIAYWEGSVRADGTVRGRGYVELTGYAERFRTPI